VAVAAAADPQVDHVQGVAAQRAQVLVDLRPQVGRGALVQPGTLVVPLGADLGGDVQVGRLRRGGPCWLT
jgi:hypothetical protein